MQLVPGPLKLVRMASPAEGPAAYNPVLTLKRVPAFVPDLQMAEIFAPERDDINKDHAWHAWEMILS